MTDFKGVFMKFYNIVESRVKLSNKTLFHGKMTIAFADNIGLSSY